MQTLRAQTRLYEKIRYVPYLLQTVSSQRRDSRSAKSILVTQTH